MEEDWAEIQVEVAPYSDVDLLVRFHDDSGVSLFDLMDIEAAFSEMFGRSVDLVEEDAIVNPYRRRSIMSSRLILYSAQRV